MTGRTRIVALFGYPITHSRSPEMHNAAFRALHLDYRYVPFAVAPPALRTAVAGIRAFGMVGANVTIPHKERVMPYLDELSDEARLIGAVNTIHHDRGRLVGHNTDARGFLRAFREETEVSVRGGRFLVLGAGGAARAVVTALALGGAKGVTVANRSRHHARRLVTSCRRAFPATDWSVSEWTALPPSRSFKGLIHATPLGMHGADPCPISPEWIHPPLAVYDLVYGLRTKLIALAEAAGARAAGGRSMLVHQGALAFTIWTGRRAPLDVMRAALGD